MLCWVGITGMLHISNKHFGAILGLVLPAVTCHAHFLETRGMLLYAVCRNVATCCVITGMA